MKKFFLILTILGASFSLGAQSSDAVISSEHILQMVKNKPETFGLSTIDVAECAISDRYKDKSTGITHAYVQQNLKGMPVINGILGLHFDKTGSLVHFANNFFATKGSAITIPTFNLEQMTTMASASVGMSMNFADFEQINPGNKAVNYLESKRYYYPCLFSNEDELVPVVNFVFYNAKTSDWWNILVSANGDILSKINWTSQCAFHTKNTHATWANGDTSTFNAFNFPTESPLYNTRKILKNAHDSLASPFGWNDQNGVKGAEFTTTIGNNVLASEDHDGDNVAGASPDGGAEMNFDFSYNPSDFNPLNYEEFAVTNLFVANNLMHDILYQYGFDETSGNFQFNNYSRGGVGSDEVNADAQDGSGTDNANFSTPPDGSNPRMQMFIWSASSLGGATLQINSPQFAKFKVGSAQFGPALTTTPIKANVVYVNDGTGDGRKGCKTLKNSAQLAGKIAIIERGNCLFVDKVLFAQNAGAIAAVILDTSSADRNITMSGTNSQIIIPSVFVRLGNVGEITEQMLGGIVNISLYDSSGTIPKTDSDLDLGVIAHEYGHGVSNRLTCGPSNTSALANAEQMGEGWSDYLGLALTVKPSDIGTTPRGIGNWLIGENETGGGIREYPYSTNMAVNPHTYKNIKLNAVSGRTEVHYLGEVWCVMLWDLHWKMIEKYGNSKDLYYGTGGNNKTLKLVLEGMKLQKCNPGFVDGRDAILKADSLLNGAANSKLIWEVFARRGLGFSAKQGSSNSTSDGTEAFDLPSAFGNGVHTVSVNIASVRPNPATDMIIVEPLLTQSITTVELFDSKGALVKVAITNGPNESKIINTENIAQGLYWVNVIAGDQKQVIKVIKN